MSALGLSGEGEVYEEIVNEDGSRAIHLRLCRMGRNGRHREVLGGRVIRLVGRMVAGLNAQALVRREDRSVDDPSEQGDGWLRARQHVVDDRGGRMYLFGPTLRDPHPGRNTGEEMPHPVLREFTNGQDPRIVAMASLAEGTESDTEGRADCLV